MINAGETPKLIRSASESSSTPKFEFVFKSLANLPSILSRNDANTIRDTDISHLPSIANFRAVNPSVSERNVNKLGIRLLRVNLRINYFNFRFSKSARIVSPEIEVWPSKTFTLNSSGI